MDNHLDAEICDSAQTLARDFFNALTNGSDEIHNFVEKWEAFGRRVESCNTALTTETLSRIYPLICTVDTVSASLVDFQSSSETLALQLSSEISQIVEAGLGNLSLDSEKTCNAVETSSGPPYIELAAEWLLQNLHNPYPSVDVKNSISQKVGTPRKDIDAWFVDARRRIGWNALRRKHFNNRQVDIVDAAKKFYLNSEGELTLTAAVENGFVAIEASAHSLFLHKFNTTKLAIELDSAVRDMTPGLRQQISGERRKNLRRREKNPYPTPERSPTTSSGNRLPSPTPSFSDLSVASSSPDVSLSSISPLLSPIDNSTVTPIPSSRKRSRNSEDEYDSSPLPESKRSKTNCAAPAHRKSPIGLLSPAASVHEDLGTPPNNGQTPSSETKGLLAPIMKRKRSISSGEECESSSKRQCRAGQTRHVSEPMSQVPSGTQQQTSTREWFTDIFGLLTDIDFAVPPLSVDFSTDVPLQVEPFNFASPNFDLFASESIANSLFTPTHISVNIPRPDDSSFPWSEFSDTQANPVAFPALEDSQLSAEPDQLPPNLFPELWSSSNIHIQPSLLPLPTQSSISLPGESPAAFSNLEQQIPPVDWTKDAKARRLHDLESQCIALRAELAAI